MPCPRSLRAPSAASSSRRRRTGKFTGSGLTKRLSEQEDQAAWREIVGDSLALNSFSVSMRDCVLSFRSSEPAARYLLYCSVETKHLARGPSLFRKESAAEACASAY